MAGIAAAWKYGCRFQLYVKGIIAALHIELQFNVYCLFSLSLRSWRVQDMGLMNYNYPTAIKGTMNLAKHRSAERYLLVQQLACFNV
jgi:hypothetical protein